MRVFSFFFLTKREKKSSFTEKSICDELNLLFEFEQELYLLSLYVKNISLFDKINSYY